MVAIVVRRKSCPRVVSVKLNRLLCGSDDKVNLVGVITAGIVEDEHSLFSDWSPDRRRGIRLIGDTVITRSINDLVFWRSFWFPPKRPDRDSVHVAVDKRVGGADLTEKGLKSVLHRITLVRELHDYFGVEKLR